MRQRAYPSPAVTNRRSKKGITTTPSDQDSNVSGNWEISHENGSIGITIVDEKHDDELVGHRSTVSSSASSRFVGYPSIAVATTASLSPYTTKLPREKQSPAGMLLTKDALQRYERQLQNASWKKQINPVTRLEDYHTVFRTPLHVPDSQYRYRMLGHTSRRKESVVNTACCAQTCSIFSGIAFVFLLFIGILLDIQPLYIPGSLPSILLQTTTDNINNNINNYDTNKQAQQRRQRLQYLVPGTHDKRLPTAVTAYQAAFLYLGVSVLAWYIYDPSRFRFLEKLVPNFCRRWLNQRRSHKNNNNYYDDIDDNDDGISSTALPMFQGSSERVMAAYRNSLLRDRIIGPVQRWLVRKGYNVRRRNRYAQMKKG
jgi:hypothetical protein